MRGTLEDCRRLEHDLEHALSVGVPGREPATVRGRGDQDDRLRDRGAARLGAAGRGRQPRGLRRALREARPRDSSSSSSWGSSPDRRPRMYGAQPGGCPPVAAAWADERPPSRVTPNTVARSLAVGDPSYGELAIGAARMSGGAITTVAEELIEPSTELLAEDSGVVADPAGGVAFGALVELVSVRRDRGGRAGRAGRHAVRHRAAARGDPAIGRTRSRPTPTTSWPRSASAEASACRSCASSCARRPERASSSRTSASPG